MVVGNRRVVDERLTSKQVERGDSLRCVQQQRKAYGGARDGRWVLLHNSTVCGSFTQRPDLSGKREGQAHNARV